jgi:hypothetical protein
LVTIEKVALKEHAEMKLIEPPKIGTRNKYLILSLMYIYIYIYKDDKVTHGVCVYILQHEDQKQKFWFLKQSEKADTRYTTNWRATFSAHKFLSRGNF